MRISDAYLRISDAYLCISDVVLRIVAVYLGEGADLLPKNVFSSR